MANEELCPIWGTPASIEVLPSDIWSVDSPRAGSIYHISETAASDLSERRHFSDDQREALNSIIVHGEITGERAFIDDGIVASLMGGGLNNSQDSSLAERENRLLLLFIKSSDRVGKWLQFPKKENDEGVQRLLAWSTSRKLDELDYLIKDLQAKGFVEFYGGDSGDKTSFPVIIVTPLGFDNPKRDEERKLPQESKRKAVVAEDVAIDLVHCNTCVRQTDHKVIVTHKNKIFKDEIFDDYGRPEYSIDGYTDWVLLECQGCKTICLRSEQYFSEWFTPGDPYRTKDTYFPKRNLGLRLKPNWYDQLKDIPELQGDFVLIAYDQAYELLGERQHIAAMLTCRALLETITVQKVGDKGGFLSKLNRMVEHGLVLETQVELLNNQIYDAGSASMHRSYNPSSKAVGSVLDIIENLIHTIYIQPEIKKTLESEKPRRI